MATSKQLSAGAGEPVTDIALRALLESAPQPMFMKDLDGRYVAVNGAFQHAVRRDAAALTGRREEDVFPPEAAAVARAADETALRTGTSATVLRRDLPGMGETLHADTRFPVRAADGRLIGVGGIITAAEPSGGTSAEGAAVPFTLPPLGPRVGSYDHFLGSFQVHFSSGIAQMLGIGHQPFDWTMDQWDSRIHPDDQARIREARRLHHLAGRGTFDQQYRVRHEGGGYRWIWSRGIFQRDTQGKPRHVVGSMIDLTEQRQAIEREQAHELMMTGLARAESLFLARGDLDIAFDAVLRVVMSFTSSPRAQALVVEGAADGGTRYRVIASAGASAEDCAPGQPPAAMAPEGLLAAVVRSGMPALDAGVIGPAPARTLAVLPVLNAEEVLALLVLADRQTGYDQALTRMLAPVLGSCANMLTIVSSRAAQQRAEAALRESEQRYRELVELSPNGVLVTIDGQVLFANQVACDVIGIPRREDIVGTLPHLRLNPDDRRAVEERVRRIVEEGWVPPFMEVDMEMYDGKVKTVEFTGCRVTFGGKPALQTILRDVTERKRAREREARSRRLESLGTLAGGVAHDFNNILTALQVNLDLVAQELPGHGDAAEAMRQARMAGERAAALVRQILSFSRSRPESREPVDLSALVMEVLGLVRVGVPAAIDLQPRVEPGLPPILGNASQLHQVLINLVTNAVHAIGGVPGCIRIETRFVPGAGRGEVHLSVSDTGEGMDPHTLERVFDPFFTTKGPREGTGLGLSIVHEVLRAHDGRVDVRSRRGEGTTFDLYFPVSAAMQPASVAEPEEVASGLRVLLLDADPAVSAVFRVSLVRAGLDATTFGNPAVALEALRASPTAFDVAVVDLALPVMNGLDFVQAARALVPDLPVVLISGLITEEDERRARAQDVDQVVGKPFVVNRLIGAICRAAERRRRSAERASDVSG